MLALLLWDRAGANASPSPELGTVQPLLLSALTGGPRRVRPAPSGSSETKADDGAMWGVSERGDMTSDDTDVNAAITRVFPWRVAATEILGRSDVITKSVIADPMAVSPWFSAEAVGWCISPLREPVIHARSAMASASAAMTPWRRPRAWLTPPKLGRTRMGRKAVPSVLGIARVATLLRDAADTFSRSDDGSIQDPGIGGYRSIRSTTRSTNARSSRSRVMSSRR
jgi:hypothetical protein